MIRRRNAGSRTENTATGSAGPGLPVSQRRVCRDAGAQERGDLAEVEGVRDAEGEVLVDDDVGGVAALGDDAVPVDAAVGMRVASGSTAPPQRGSCRTLGTS